MYLQVSEIFQVSLPLFPKLPSRNLEERKKESKKERMLSRALSKTWVPAVKATCFKSTLPAGKMIMPSHSLFTAHVEPAKVMPNPLIGEEAVEDKAVGTGAPPQRGHHKPLVWKRRCPWFTRQWTLDLHRVKKGPETPTFENGVPFTLIRTFRPFAGRSFRVNAGRRRKIRLSLKRGRRKLL
jgi:hypothetical protein